MTGSAIANECYQTILQIAKCHETTIDKYALLHQVFVAVVNEHTLNSTLNFSGPYARFDFLCHRTNYPAQAIRRINAFRNRAMRPKTASEGELKEKWPFDLKAVAEFAECLYQLPLPAELKALLPTHFPKEEYQGLHNDCIRAVVRSVDAERHIVEAQPIDCDERTINVGLLNADIQERNFTYMEKLMAPGDRVNLVNTQLRDGIYWPELVVYMPDLLIDVTTVAGCFKEYGCSPYHFLLSMLSERSITSPILLGNFASQMLDEEVNQMHEDTPFESSARRFFQDNAAKMAVCQGIDSQFKDQARVQQFNLRNMVRRKFPEIPDYRQDDVLIEPTFFSEMLGLSGRMDLAQTNLKVIIEQKSGKRNYYTNGHQEYHYVQVLLYRAIVHYNFGLPNNQIDTYLLYSKFDDGLLKEGPAPKLLAEAMRVRNQVARLLILLADGQGEKLFMHLTPEVLNTRKLETSFWKNTLRPQILDALQPLFLADELTRKYFFRMMTFVAKEHLLAKIGTADREASGAAAMWNATTAEKLAAGNMLLDLSIKQLKENTAGEGIAILSMTSDPDSHEALPNFRVGDTVVLYPYQVDAFPDATKTMLFRANIVSILPDEVMVELRDPQKNRHVFRTGELKVRWAMEHDFADSNHTGLYRSVAGILRAREDRRLLLLGKRTPRTDLSIRPLGDYGAFQPMVTQFVQARDYMLLIGPPGTGKTSFGLMNILHEQLDREKGPVLLLSFTNRAVNEICSKLVEQEMDFIRLGNVSSCPSAYKEYMIGEQAAKCRNMAEVKRKLQTARIFVSTTTSMLSNAILFSLLRFPLAIIDEASQILDPHLLGILCARHGSDNAIGRFVLIGDQKQLPAVAQQGEDVSEVGDTELRQIGVRNCRSSLFERLILTNTDVHDDRHNGSSQVTFMFSKQGRMHVEVADFASREFYGGRLDVVPLGHQLKPLDYHSVPDDGMAEFLASRRMVFMAVEPTNDATEALTVGADKVNRREAEVIARVAKSVYDLYLANGREFLPQATLGVIVPYRHQISCVMDALKRYAIPQLLNVTIDTVERFQGSQRDVIVYGFTVKKYRQLDFLLGNMYNDNGVLVDRKLNVALTRAREQMVMVGNPKLLSSNPTFKKLIAYVAQCGGYREA